MPDTVYVLRVLTPGGTRERFCYKDPAEAEAAYEGAVESAKEMHESDVTLTSVRILRKFKWKDYAKA